uniref:Uncharacterized protein n=1 Tax=Oryzias latipes TaxID=8090 RepID=A0A3P9KMZ7_ORYLA
HQMPHPYPESRFLPNTFGTAATACQGTHPHHRKRLVESWNRLYHAATLPSTRRGAISCGPQASANSLHLKSTYDHKHLFWSKNQILCQEETISEHRYVLDEKDIRIWVDPKRSSIHKVS